MILGYIMLNAALMAVLIWARSVLVRFMARHSAIEDEASLTAFKTVARWNMFGALAFLACGVIAILWSWLLTNQYGLQGLIIVLGVSIPSLLISLSTKKLETRARALPCSDPALKVEYERISQVWVKKALPDF
jgi:hypothetical protein